MRHVIDTLEGARPSMLSRCSMRWTPPPVASWSVRVVRARRTDRVVAMRRAYRRRRGGRW